MGERGLALESTYRQVFDATWDGTLSNVGVTGTQFVAWWPAVEGVYADSILFHVHELHGTREVRVSRAGARGIPLLAPADGDAFHFATDGVRMAWLQAYPRGGDYDRAELLVAPFALSASEIAPLVVLPLPPPPDEPVILRLADGVAAAANTSGIELFRLSDGARAVIAPDRGRSWSGGALFISPTEIALGDGPERYARVDSVVVLDRSTLRFDRP